ncbi:MAG: hypothetical protein ABI679_00165 [Gemmatimonadota bacterium]
MKAESAEQQLKIFLRRYNPEVASVARKVIAKLKKRLPGATAMVYDNYNFLVVGFGPSERASEAVLSVVLAPRRVSRAAVITFPDLSAVSGCHQPTEPVAERRWARAAFA